MRKWIGAAVALCVAIAAYGFAFGVPSWGPGILKGATTFPVCQGDDRATCKGAPHFITCQTDLVAWAKSVRPDVCITVSTKAVSAAPGGACGYTTHEVTCTRR